MTNTQHHNRDKLNDQTRACADNYRQLWSATDDALVLAQLSTDEELAYELGRTYSSIQQRRVLLKAALRTGLSLEELHAADRAQRNRIATETLRSIKIHLVLQCPECYCTPHQPFCSEA